MVSETKIDDIFPESQFLIEGFSTPYILDRTAKGVGILLYIRQVYHLNISKKITVNKSFEGFFVELKLCTDYENIILLGDFNVEVEEKYMSEFTSVHSLRNLVK